MRDETREDHRGEKGRPGSAAGQPPAQGAAGATVSIPSRPHPTPFGPTTLHARLALLRPQPLRLRPAPGNDR